MDTWPPDWVTWPGESPSLLIRVPLHVREANGEPSRHAVEHVRQTLSVRGPLSRAAGIIPSGTSASGSPAYVHVGMKGQQVMRTGASNGLTGLTTTGLTIPDPRTLAISLAYAAIGFTPIGALALTIGGLWSLDVGSLALILPAVVVAIVLGLRYPAQGRTALQGLVAGLLAVLIYDLVRWTFVALGLWGDFIPNIGGWLNGTGEPDWLLGYAFRWFGDGGGMGLAFIVLARTVLPSLSRRDSVVVGVAYGLSIWVCLLITLMVAPEGQMLLFRLTPVTLVLSWVGHVVYGAVLGAAHYWLRSQPEAGAAFALS